MSTFTVHEAKQKKTLDGKHGPMQVIALALRDGEKPPILAEWFTKASTPLPAPQSTLEGELEQSEYGWKFKKAQQPGGFGPRPEDPARAKRIMRQHSQSASIELLKLANYNGIPIPVNTVSELWSAVKQLADKLDADAEGAAS